MRRPILSLSLFFFIAAALSAEAATGRIAKVLPQLLDLKGQHAISPSLYDRDAYQAYLRQNPTNVSGMRFAVQWKGRATGAAPLKLRVEVRGSAQGHRLGQTVLEKEIKSGGWFEHWTYIPFAGEDYRQSGRVTAWRVTLWDGDRLLSEQKSFLW